MLRITIPGARYFDERDRSVFTVAAQTIVLEHSLASVYKWESKWKKPFIGTYDKTVEECIDYVRCMTITPNVDPMVYRCLTQEIFDVIDNYIQMPMTATWFKENKTGRRNHEIVTAEVVYAWMISLRMPFICERWHLNRLIAQIRVCNEMNAPKKKMNKKDIYSRNRALNAARRSRLNSNG